MTNWDPIVKWAFGFIALFLTFLWVLATMQRRCGPKEFMIIAGLGCKGKHGFKIVKEGKVLVIPFVQRCEVLSLDNIEIDIASAGPIATRDGTSVFIDAIAQAVVKDDDDSMAAAAEYFFRNYKGRLDGLSSTTTKVLFEDEFKPIAQRVILENMSRVLSAFTVAEVNDGFDNVCRTIMDDSYSELSRYGLKVATFIIKDIKEAAVKS